MASKFRLGCHDIIPPSDLDDDLLVHFGLKSNQQETSLPSWKRAVFNYDMYLRKLDEAENIEPIETSEQIDDTKVNCFKEPLNDEKVKSVEQIKIEKVSTESEKTCMISSQASSSTAKITKTHTVENTNESSVDSIRETLTLIGQYAEKNPYDPTVEDEFWKSLTSKLEIHDFFTVQAELLNLDTLSSELKHGILKKLCNVSTSVMKSLETDEIDQVSFLQPTLSICKPAEVLKDKLGQSSTYASYTDIAAVHI